MPHVLPDHPDPTRKRLAVFVHGFGSSAACWEPLLRLMREDPEITDSFDLACYEYPTPWFNLKFLRRIPTLKEIAGGLTNFLESADLRRYRECALIGHSQGGLVIESYLVDRLNEGKAEDLYRLREVILISTPNLGSTLLMGPRRFLSIFFSNPLERTLRVFDTEITEMRTAITERIVGARGDSSVAWPVPVQCIYGIQDAVVREPSAIGPFDKDTLRRVAGDHFNVIQPPSRDHERYKILAEALMDPSGHRCVYEIDLYDIRVAIEPIPGGRTFEFPRASGEPIRVHTDNVAQVDRSLKFSRNNRCSELFLLGYGTRQGGCVKGRMSHRNEAPPRRTQVQEDYSNSVEFGFHPLRGDTYRLVADVYKGFDRGNRDLHFHLIPHERKVYYKKVRIKLDLTAYLSAGWTLTKVPMLYHHPREVEHSELCTQRLLGEPVSGHEDQPEGIWSWELTNLRGGVVDLIWDAAEPVPAAAGS
jgi:pimeloyl-ACP methyl ester carboxylesterase